MHGSLTGLRLIGQEVHLVVTKAENLRLLGRAAVPLLATKDTVNAKDQLLEEKRLGHVVVGADLEAEQPVGVGRLGGQKQDGHPAAGGAEPLAHLEPVQLRHHDVEDHKIELDGSGEPKTLLAIVSGGRGKPLELQIVGEGIRKMLLVIDNQDVLLHFLLTPRGREYSPERSILRAP